MTEDGLATLRNCCSPAVLQSLELLVSTATMRKAQTHAQLNKFDKIFSLCRGLCHAPPSCQVRCVSEEGEVPLSSVGLPDDLYDKTQRLFASSNVALKRDRDTLRTEIKQPAENLPLVLCIAVQGLASLAHTQ